MGGTSIGVEAMELRYSFKDSASYFYCYLARTVAESVVALVLLAYICWWGLPILSCHTLPTAEARGQMILHLDTELVFSETNK